MNLAGNRVKLSPYTGLPMTKPARTALLSLIVGLVMADIAGAVQLWQLWQERNSPALDQASSVRHDRLQSGRQLPPGSQLRATTAR